MNIRSYTLVNLPNGKQIYIEISEKGFHVRDGGEHGKVLMDASLLSQSGHINIYTDVLKITEHRGLFKLRDNREESDEGINLI